MENKENLNAFSAGLSFCNSLPFKLFPIKKVVSITNYQDEDGIVQGLAYKYDDGSTDFLPLTPEGEHEIVISPDEFLVSEQSIRELGNQILLVLERKLSK